MGHRSDATAALDRDERLAELGQQLVDLAATGAGWECPFCDGVLGGEHDMGEIAGGECPLAEYLRDFLNADTEPAPPPDDAPSEANAVPDEATPVFTSAGGEEPAVRSWATHCGYFDERLGARGEYCELAPGHSGDHGRGSRVPGKMVGAGRGTKDEGGAT